MNRRRGEFLAEMGLAPVWRLRRSAVPSGENPSPDASADRGETNRETDISGLGWVELKSRVAGCVDCKLRAGCTQTVFGVGDERAQWMLVGEAPGADEDRLGEPFVGQA